MSFELRDLRTKLLIVLGVLLVLDLAAIAVLHSPMGGGNQARQQRYEQLQQRRLVESRAAAATEGMEQKIATAHEQERNFSQERLISRYSEMSEKLSQIAGKAGVSVTDVKYGDSAGDADREKSAVPAGYSLVTIVMRVHGSYAQDMHFINAVERQKTLLLIDAVSFGGMKGNQLTVSVHMTTYLRSAA